MKTAMNHSRNGFSLVEVMVGLGIGMISMLVMMQVFAVFEGGKRTTTGGGDAQNNGAVGLYMIENDVKMAGWGMDADLYGNCTNTFSYCDGSAGCGGVVGPLTGFSFTALEITDGVNGAPDMLSARYFANPEVSTFRLPANTTLQSTMTLPLQPLTVGSSVGCSAGDMVLVAQAGNCTLLQISQIQNAPVITLSHNSGSPIGVFNPSAAYRTDNGWPLYSSGARATCFPNSGASVSYQRAYSINTATRQLQRTVDGAVELAASDIMDLQAQYGVAPASSQVVNQWVDATAPTWSNPTPADVRRIKAVRVALVARSGQYEKPASGTACNTTTPAMAAAWSSWAVFNTGNYPNDWQCYRYKVFETVIPLRNVIWGNL